MKDLKTKILNRFALVYLGFLVFAFITIFNIIKLQFFERDKWTNEQEKYTVKNITIEPNRGNIFSDNGYLLKSSVPYYEIRFDSQVESLTDKIFNEHLDSLAYYLGKEFNKPAAYYYKKFTRARQKGNRYLFIAKKVTNTQLQRIKKFPIFRLGKYKGGLIVQTSTARVQPFPFATRTLGYIDKNDYAIVGIEGAYDKYLKGQKGYKLMQKLYGNVWKELPTDNENNTDAKNGFDVQTTINLEIQDITHHALLNQLIEQDANHGTAVVMEVKTGEIKAISNLGKDKNGNYRELFNYAVGEPFEPGSTFKLASMIAAIEDGYISDLNDTVNTGNGITYYYNHKMQDSHHGGYGVITYQQAFEKSSNVGISKIIYKYYKKQPRKFVERLYELHLGNKLGLEIKGEKKPFIKYPGDKYWSGISLPQMSIGYELKITPLQILAFYNAIANDGKLVRPQFVKYFLDHGETIKTIEPHIIDASICSKEAITKAKKLLEGVVINGTATNVKNPYFKIAGKTGTAQIAYRSGGYKAGNLVQYTASFVGYFPADNPLYSIIVVVFKPNNGKYYGSQVAAPVFKEIADKIYATQFQMTTPINLAKVDTQLPPPIVKYGYKKDITAMVKQLNISTDSSALHSDWAVCFNKPDKLDLQNRFFANHLVPNIKGMGLKDAIYVLENLGLNVTPIGMGTVVYQSIKPGEKINNGDKIFLKLVY